MVPRPALFHPEVPPPGFELNLVSFWRERPVIDPRLQLFHTNGAPNEGSVTASKAWAERRVVNGNATTCPHLQIDRRGRAALLLPTNRKGIGNFQVAAWSLVFETADTGTNQDPTISEFTDFQIEKCATAAAYYHIVHGIPLQYPATWDGAGTASHTEPFGFDKWTNSPGKICPGQRKKDQLREVILPLARRIVADWTAPEDEVTAEEVEAIVRASEARIIARVNRSIEVTREGRQEQRDQFRVLRDELTDNDNAE